jgi:hypothetical protein
VDGLASILLDSHKAPNFCVEVVEILQDIGKKSMVGVAVAIFYQGSPRKREPIGSCREEDMEGKTFQHDVKERHCQT